MGRRGRLLAEPLIQRHCPAALAIDGNVIHLLACRFDRPQIMMLLE